MLLSGGLAAAGKLKSRNRKKQKLIQSSPTEMDMHRYNYSGLSQNDFESRYEATPLSYLSYFYLMPAIPVKLH